MRIVILGDFHLNPDALELTEAAMEDIRAVQPDLVVALGDFGDRARIGTPEGIRQAAAFLAKTGAPVHPILGNHDLQNESAGAAPRGRIEAVLRETYGLTDSGGFLEFESFRLLLITSEAQDPVRCLQVQECVVSEAQVARIEEGMARRPGVPVIVFSHAPPLGCGLRTVHGTHLRATNAWLNHNHHPARWSNFYRKHPEVLLWFSAHYHIGHDHPDSQNERDGVRFFHTQVHGDCTRDGSRQSRVLDLTKEGITLSTLDHRLRRIVSPPHWGGPLRPRVTLPSSVPQEIVIGGRLCEPGLIAVDFHRVLASMDDGYLWELNLPYESAMGTLHMGGRVDAVLVTGGYVWRAWGEHLGVCAIDAPGRFVRQPDTRLEDQIAFRLPSKIAALRADGEGAIIASTVCGHWRCAPGASEACRVDADAVPLATEAVFAGQWAAGNVTAEGAAEILLPLSARRTLHAFRLPDDPDRTRFLFQNL